MEMSENFQGKKCEKKKQFFSSFFFFVKKKIMTWAALLKQSTTEESKSGSSNPTNASPLPVSFKPEAANGGKFFESFSERISFLLN